jgi:hypothetical protein
MLTIPGKRGQVHFSGASNLVNRKTVKFLSCNNAAFTPAKPGNISINAVYKCTWHFYRRLTAESIEEAPLSGYRLHRQGHRAKGGDLFPLT